MSSRREEAGLKKVSFRRYWHESRWAKLVTRWYRMCSIAASGTGIIWSSTYKNNWARNGNLYNKSTIVLFSSKNNNWKIVLHCAWISMKRDWEELMNTWNQAILAIFKHKKSSNQLVWSKTRIWKQEMSSLHSSLKNQVLWRQKLQSWSVTKVKVTRKIVWEKQWTRLRWALHRCMIWRLIQMELL